MATTLASDIAFTQLPMKTKKAILGQCPFFRYHSIESQTFWLILYVSFLSILTQN